MLSPFIEQITRPEAVRRLKSWIEARSPAALVRFNEGEARIICASMDDPESMKIAWRKLFRQSGKRFTSRELLTVQSEILFALDNADICGVTSTLANEEHRSWAARTEAILASRAADAGHQRVMTDGNINLHLSKILHELISGAESVGIISSRDLREVVKTKFGVKEVRLYQTPSEFVERAVDGEYEVAMHGVDMWPTAHRKITAELAVSRPGEVFLVGAGPFGKNLCIRVKERGGIAIDMGAELDTLSGRQTRYKERVKATP